MAGPPKLTTQQKNSLGKLEPALREAVRLGDYPTASQTFLEIQNVLRPTGHQTRLNKARNWLSEAAIEAEQIEEAKSRLGEVRLRTARRTRTHLEASALLAICYLREKDTVNAEPLIGEVMRSETVVRSRLRRRQLQARLYERFAEEALLVSMTGVGGDALDRGSIQSEAGMLIQSCSQDEMFAEMGRSLPRDALGYLFKVDELARGQLAPVHHDSLPTRENLVENKLLGQSVFAVLRRALWRPLCHPASEIRRVWMSQGLMALLDRQLLVSAVVAAMNRYDVKVKTLAVAVTALLIKQGLDGFCERYQPEGIMVSRGGWSDQLLA